MSDNWDQQIKAFEAKIKQRIKTVHVNVAKKLEDSVRLGTRTDAGRITGSPGQPVDTGYLRNSWQLDFPSELLARLTTNVAYAPAIEEGVRSAYDPAGEDRPPEYDKEAARAFGGRSEVGGNHSVKLTRAGFEKLVRQAVREEVR